MIDHYLTITSSSIGNATYTARRSRFIAFAHHVDDPAEAMNIIGEYRRKYHNARHVCSAYVLGVQRDVFRANDDGEPSGTAGRPILGQITRRGLTDVLVVVVRYYGGINLGTSGLIAAYRAVAADALDNARKEERIIENCVSWDFDYREKDAVMRVVKEMNARIVKQHFDTTCNIVVSVRRSHIDELLQRLKAVPFRLRK